jgi:hypothetical protein
MTFKTAWELLNEGKPIKRPYWDGYWIKEDSDVIIHLKEGYNINLLDTDDVMFTLSHMACDDWELATHDNCKRLRDDENA